MAADTALNAPFSLRNPGWLAAAGIALIPVVSYTQLLDFRLMPRALLMGILAMFLLVMVARKIFRKNIQLHPIRWHLLWPFLLLAAAYALTAFTALNTAEALFWVNKQLLLLLLAFIIFIMTDNRMMNISTISIGVACGLVLALVLFFHELFGFDFRHNTLHDLATPFGHKNLYAAWLVISLPFLLILIRELRQGAARTAIIVLAFTVPVITLLLQAKAATIALVIMALFYGVIYLSRYPRKQQIVFGGIILMLMIMGVAALFALDGKVYTLRSGSFEERMIVWGNTWQMIGDQPLWGVGGGNWQIHFPKYGLHDFHGLNEKVYLAYETFQRPHNDYLWVFAEAGIIGLLAWFGIPGTTIWCFFKARGWQRGIGNQRVVMTGGVLAFFVIAMADFPLERFEHMMMMVLMYVFAIPGEKPEQNGSRVSLQFKGVMLLALILFVYLIIAMSARMKAEHNHYKMLKAHSLGDWLYMSRIASTTNERVFNIDNFSIPVSWYEGVAQSALGNVMKAKEHFEEAYRVNPWQVHVINNLAGCHQQLGESSKALQYYQKALNIAPLHYEVLLNKSITLYKSGHTDGAFHTLLQLVYKKEHQPTYHQAMPVIFNAYLQKLIEKDEQGSRNHASIEKVIRSDSLKIVVLYHYQIESMDLEELLEGF